MQTGEIAETVYGTEQWLEFAGRLHPLVLHMPIGLLAAVLLLEFVSLFSRGAVASRRVLYSALAVSAVIASSTGWLLASGGEYGGDLIDDHRKLGIAAAVIACLAAGLDLFGRSGRMAAGRRGMILLCAAAIGAAGHHGGMISHGRKFLSSTAPPWLAPYLTKPKVKRPVVVPPPEVAPNQLTTGSEPSMIAAPLTGPATGDAGPSANEPGTEVGGSGLAMTVSPAADSPGTDIALVLAAFRETCFECHNEDKSKGSLRLDELEGWIDCVDTDFPEDSEMLYRVLLPRDDDDAMPPKGDALDPAVIEALQRWIEAGAPTEELQRGLGIAVESEKQAVLSIDAVRAATGARIEPIAQDISLVAAKQRLDVSWRHVDQFPERARLAALASIAAQVVELDLAGRDLGSDGLAGLPLLPALERVHLERTGLSDAAIRTLCERAPALRYVNLHSTNVTSAVFDAVAALPALECVVLFGTTVTRSEADTFQAMRPAVKVTLDAGFPASAQLSSTYHRRILAADASKGRVALLREIAIGRPKVLWEHKITDLHDLQWLGDTEDGHGRVLIQESWTRIVEVNTATDEVLWSYDASEGTDGPVEIHSFRRLDDGTTMIAESGTGRIVFVDGAGQVTDSIALVVDAPDAHHDTRLVRPTPSGTFLVAHEKDGVVREYDRAGNMVWTFEVPLFERARASGLGVEAHGNQVFAAVRRANGETLITTGNGSSILFVAPDGTIRRRITSDDLEGVDLAWVTTVQELSSGNLVLTNCHGDPAQPQAVEITPENEIVWSFRDVELFGDSLSNLLVLEAVR